MYICAAAMIPTTIYVYSVHTHTKTPTPHTEEVKMRHTQTTKNNYFESHVQHPLLSPFPHHRAAEAVELAAAGRKYIVPIINNKYIFNIIYISHYNHCGGIHIIVIQAYSGIGESIM